MNPIYFAYDGQYKLMKIIFLFENAINCLG